MPRNGSGTYDAPSNSWNPAVSGTSIDSSDWASLLADIETALSGSIAKDGQTVTTAAIPFASGIQTDTVSEKTSAAGVTVDGVLVKDGGATLKDSVTLFVDTTNTAKKLQFECSGISSGVTRIVTWPDSDIIPVGTTLTQTLTNKTINLSSNTLSGTIAQFNSAISDGDMTTTGANTFTDTQAVSISSSGGEVKTLRAINPNGSASTAVTVALQPSASELRAAHLKATNNGSNRIDLDVQLSNGTDPATVATFTGGGGVQVGAPTGGDQGSGTANAGAVYDDGKLLSTVKVASTAASASSNVAFTLSDGEHYRVVFSNVSPATDAVNFMFRVSTDGGSTFAQGATDYRYGIRGIGSDAGNGDTSSAGASAILLGSATAQGNAANEKIDGYIDIFAPGDTGYTNVFANLTMTTTGGVLVSCAIGGQYFAATTAVNAIQFFMSSGNIASGQFDLYAMKV